MPPIDPVRAPRAKPKSKKPYSPPASSRSDAAQRAPRPAPRLAPKPRPTGVFARPVTRRADAPITRARSQAQRRVDRAKRRMPARSTPVIPTIRNPTRSQQRAVNRAVSKEIKRRVGPGGSGAQRQERQRVVLREIRTDPRYARLNSAIRGASKTNTERLAVGTARSMGVRGSRAHKIRVGRALLRQAARRDRVAAAPPPKVLTAGPASLNLTDLRRAVIGATSLGAATAENEFFKNAVRDVGTLATGPFVGGFELGAAAVEAIGGDTGRAQRLGRGVVQGVKESVPGQLAQGDVEGAASAFTKHPVLSAVDVAGVAAVGGRTAGAIARGAGSRATGRGPRGALARAGSTVRPPLAVTSDASSPVVSRRYSKDLTRKAVQVAADRRLQPLKRADGSVVTVRERGREVPVLLAPRGARERMQRREADFVASRANSVERLVRDQVGSEMRARGIRGKRAKDLVAMAVEGTITSARHFERDLKAHRDRLRREIESGEYRHRGELAAAQARLRTVERALADPRVMRQKAEIVAAAERIGRRLNEGEREAIGLGMLNPVRAERAKRVPAAVEHLGARHFSPEELRDLARVEGDSGEALRHGAIRHPDGRFLSNEQVDEFLRSRGRDPGSVAYLPHRMDVRGSRAFHSQFRPGGRPVLDKAESRTGSAYRKGATEASTDLIREQGVRQGTQIAKARQVDRLVSDQGMARPDGRYFTAKEALELAQRLESDAGERYVPMRAFAAKLDRETQRMIRDELQGPGGMDSLSQRLLNDRVVRDADPPGAARARNVVLVPAATVEQMNRHLMPAGGIEKFFQILNRPFRFAVLAQPRWLAGNFVEPYIIRLTTRGSGVNVFGLGVDITAATRLLRRMDRSPDPKVRTAAQELRAQQLGGLFIGGRGASVRRSVDELPVYGDVVGRLPVMRQGAELLRRIGHALMVPGNAYFRVNRAIENGAQRGALGKNIREDLQDFTGSWTATLRLHKDALDEVAQGLVNTPTQRRFMRAQHEILGKYEGYAPWMRRLTQSIMPFMPWALNAARFVFWTMPAHRTVQEALLLKVNEVVAKDWEEIHKNTPPGSLRFAVPTKDGGWIDLARYTPYGLTIPVQQGELEGLNQVAPQLQGPMASLFSGDNPFGDPLQIEGEPYGSASTGQRLGVAANQLAEALIPYVSQARRLQEGGGTAYDSSNVFDPDVKPGTQAMSATRRVFDPLRPTYLGGKPTAPAPADEGPDSLDDRINRALDAVGSDLDVGGDVDERINRALDRLSR